MKYARISAGLLVAAALALFQPFTAAAGTPFFISGRVVDSAGAGVGGIRVEIWDEGNAFMADERLDIVYANGAGNWSTNKVEPGHDIYLVIRWDFLMTPPVFNGHEIDLVDDTAAGGACGVATKTYQDIQTATRLDITNPTAPFNATMFQAQPAGLATMLQRIKHVLQYMNTNKGNTGWSVNYDIKVHIDNSNMRYFFCSSVDQAITIGTGGFAAGGSTFDILSLYHEVGHLTHYRHNGNSLPPSEAGCGTHTVNSEEGIQCALVEAWPSYQAQLVAEANGVVSAFYTSYRDPNKTHWRGDEARPSGLRESGENVEGAVAGYMFGLDSDPSWKFADNLRVMINDKPNNVRDHLVGFVADQGGAGTAGTKKAYGISQDHGMTYNRATFRATPFSEEGPPPNDAPSSMDGNFKLIDGFSFLRGTVTTRVNSLDANTLGVATRQTNAKAKIGYKPAAAMIVDNPTQFMNFTPQANMNAGTVDIELDTTGFNAQSGDGDWDLLAVSENTDGFEDNFKPAWTGDGQRLLSTEEHGFKFHGAWYELGFHEVAPIDDKKGKVIVDNTAPNLQTGTLEPQ